MEELNHYISGKIADRLLKKELKTESLRKIKIQFSIESILNDCEKFFILYVIFLFADYIKEFLLCGIAIILTRPSLGGLHMKTYQGCLMFTFCYYLISIIGGSCFSFSKNETIIIISVNCILMVIFAPIKSPQYPEYSYKQKVKFKIEGIGGLIIIAILHMLLNEEMDYLIWILLLQQLEIAVVAYKKFTREEDNADERSKRSSV